VKWVNLRVSPVLYLFTGLRAGGGGKKNQYSYRKNGVALAWVEMTFVGVFANMEGRWGQKWVLGGG